MNKWLSNERSEFHKAASLGLKTDIKFFLDIDFQVDCLDSRGWTPLHCACEGGRVDAVCLLLKRGADPKRKTPMHETTMHLAARSGCARTIKVLEQCKVSINDRTAQGRTPLHEAAVAGREAAIRTLLALGAPVSMRSFEEYTPLHLAARGGHVGAAQELLDAGALVDDGPVTPLHLAAEQGSSQLIESFIQHGADVMALTPNGDTPLHLALLRGNKNAAETLVRFGADLEANGYLDSKPLHCAVLCQPRVVSWLLSLGAQPNPRDGDGATPMSWAVAHKRLNLGQEETQGLLKRRGGELVVLKCKSIGYPPMSEGTTLSEKVLSWMSIPVTEEETLH